MLTMDHIPNEITFNILSEYLELRDVLTFSLTCRKYYELVNSYSFINLILKRELNCDISKFDIERARLRFYDLMSPNFKKLTRYSIGWIKITLTTDYKGNNLYFILEIISLHGFRNCLNEFINLFPEFDYNQSFTLGHSALIHAVRNSDLWMVNRLLLIPQLEVSKEFYISGKYHTALNNVKFNDLSILKSLLESNRVSEYDIYNTLYDNILSNNNLAFYQVFFNHSKIKIDPNYILGGDKNFTPLALACANRELDIVKLFAEVGVLDITKRIGDCLNAIETAMSRENTNILEFLLDYSREHTESCIANLLPKKFNDLPSCRKEVREANSVLDSTTFNLGLNKPKAFNLLINYELPGELTGTYEENIKSVLHLACLYGRIELVKGVYHQLYDSSNLPGYSSYTPLLCACARDQYDVAKYIIENGYENTEIYEGKKGFLHCTDDKRIFKMLLDKSGDIYQRDKSGMTPLMYAARRGNVDIVEMILEKDDRGINMLSLPNDIYDQTKTALMLGAENGNLSCVKALLKSPKIFPHFINNKGESAITLVMKKRYLGYSWDVDRGLIETEEYLRKNYYLGTVVRTSTAYLIGTVNDFSAMIFGKRFM